MDLSEINMELFRAINHLSYQLELLNPLMIFLAKYMEYILIAGVIIYWFTRTKENRIMVISAIISFIVAEIFGKLLGKIHSNFQPFVTLQNTNKLIDHAIDNSFPSDHAIQFFSICIVFLFFKKNLRYIWLALAILVAISRIWVGVHYPLDVIVGALLGTITALLSCWVIPRVHFIDKLLALYVRGEQYVIDKVTN